MTDGVITIATGRYHMFVEPLATALGAEGFCDRLFVLTDNEELLRGEDGAGGSVPVTYLPYGRLPWPFPTLWRYHAIASYSRLLREEVSHLMYMDVDMRPVAACPELFASDLFAVQHPGFWDKSPLEATFCPDPRSRAFHDPSPRDRYVAGGVQGGAIEAFLDAAGTCAQAIEADLLDGVIAVWHDESHWNRFVNSRPEITVFGPEYCWPESSPAPESIGAPRILALDKDHHEMRGTKPTMSERLNRFRPVRWAGQLRHWAGA